MDEYEVFVKAERIVRSRGWVRWTLEAPDEGAVCTRGAFALALYGDVREYGGELEHVERQFKRINKIPHWKAVTSWNDSRRKGKQVLRALHKAAQATRAEHERRQLLARIPSTDLRIADSAHHFILEA